MKDGTFALLIVAAWSGVSGCGSGTVDPKCETFCSPAGATECTGGRVHTCVADAQGCLDWTTWSDCAQGACADSHNCSVCSNACSPERTTECAVGKIRTCVADVQGCLDWSTWADCELGDCADAFSCGGCSDGCPVSGKTRCDGGRLYRCETDAHGCLNWGAPSACEFLSCADAEQCSACDDSCSPVGATQCADGEVRGCVAEADGCPGWTDPVACLSGACRDDKTCDDCVPDCLGRECDLDPVCHKQSCGGCTLPETCGGDGTPGFCGGGSELCGPGSFFVAKNGNDGNPGTIELPWATIQKAAETLVAGDVVCIREGDYFEQVNIKNSGTEGHPITFTSYPGETAVINGTGVDIDEVHWHGLLMIWGKENITISNLAIKNSEWFGIFVNQCEFCDGDAGIFGYATNIRIENNYIYNTTASGILVQWGKNIIIDGNELELACNKQPPGAVQEIISIAYRTDGFEILNNYIHHGGTPELGGEGIDAKNGAENGSIHHNVVHDVNSVGIYVDAWDKWARNIEVYSNLVHDVKGSGFAVSAEVAGGRTENVRLYNNIAYNCNISGVMVPSYGDGAVSNVSLINNTFYHNQQGGVWVGSWAAPLEQILVRNNVVLANGGWQIRTEEPLATTIDHNLEDGDPQFVNAAGGDFHLQGTSPAIDAGSEVGAPAVDFDGQSRPQGNGYDIGAFEYTP